MYLPGVNQGLVDHHRTDAERAEAAGGGVGRVMGGLRVLGIHHHGMLSAVIGHPMQRAAAMHLLAKLHAERSHCLNRQGQYQEADKSGT